VSETRLSDLVRVVLAPNPSPMTLEGTNTYLIGDSARALVIDPGPDADGHFDRVRKALGKAKVIGVFLTHWHPDHAEGADAFAETVDSVVASYREPRTKLDLPLVDSEPSGGDGLFLTPVHTPGHASDHLCYWMPEERTLFTGDHILGRGTTVIAFPDGDMADYMASLERVKDFPAERFYPGHGPVVNEPEKTLAEYIEHRLMRERQVADELPGTAAELVAKIYADVEEVLHPIAEMSVRAHLAKLAREGRAVHDDANDYWRLTERT
jgi:glyoxylase-like metal-dependent hydrolase (beta-lactamase superfamily II)